MYPALTSMDIVILDWNQKNLNLFKKMEQISIRNMIEFQPNSYRKMLKSADSSRKLQP